MELRELIMDESVPRKWREKALDELMDLHKNGHVIDLPNGNRFILTAPELEDLKRRHYIDAIKKFRENHNCGLKDGKDAIDQLDRRGLYVRTPTPYTSYGND